MSFLIIAGHRYPLEHGDTVIGGTGERSLKAPQLAQTPPVLVITYPPDGLTTARAAGTQPVTVNGDAIDTKPRLLKHGDRLETPGVKIIYGDVLRAGRTSPENGTALKDPPPPVIQPPGAAPTAATGGRITRLSDRKTVTIPDSGLTLGRDPTNDVILTSNGVSRLHAVIEPSLLGYVVRDRSVNGTWVNGERVERHCLLGQGDTMRIGLDEFRFDADDASFEL
jgi:hypothetical protein